MEKFSVKNLNVTYNGKKRETDNLDEMERQIPYSVIPIQNLVKVQLESGLLYAQYIQDHAE